MSKLNHRLPFRLARLGLSIILGWILLTGLLLMLNNDASNGRQAYASNFTDEARARLVTATFPTPTVGAYLGAYIGDLPDDFGKSFTALQGFEGLTGRRLAMVHRFWGMTVFTASQYADFDWLHLDQHFDAGKIMLISWNPVTSTTKTSITYQQIISGVYDSVIISAALDAAEFGKPLFIRWAWEMDGDWYAHSGPNAFGPNGNDPWNKVDDLNKYFGDQNKADGPERFVAAWRHIRSIFHANRADNVIWVWSPNWLSSPIPTPDLITTTWNTLDAYYPGDDQVDWIGTSIYYREDNGNERLSFPEMFDHQRGSGPSIAEFAKQHQKPVMIAEIGASEKSDDPQAKAQWIKKTYGTDVKAFPSIKAILWFSVIKEEESGKIDWRVNSSEDSLNAFKSAISDTYYLEQVYPIKIFLPCINRM